MRNTKLLVNHRMIIQFVHFVIRLFNPIIHNYTLIIYNNILMYIMNVHNNVKVKQVD